MTVTYVTRDLLNITVAMCFRESLTITEWFAKVGNYIYIYDYVVDVFCQQNTKIFISD